MLKNYIKVAVRALSKRKVFACINVFGLGLGFGCCILVLLFVRHEVTYDRFHAEAENLYVLNAEFKTMTFSSTPMPLLPALVDAYPEVVRGVRLSEMDGVVRSGAELHRESLALADPGFFQMFTFPLAAGDPATALSGVQSVVLSAEAARKYFGEEDPIGRVLPISLGGTYFDFNVTGVAEPIPSNSTVRFDLLAPMESRYLVRDRSEAGAWMNFGVTSVIQTSGPGLGEVLASKQGAFIEDHMGEAIRADGEQVSDFGFTFHPLIGYHLADLGSGNALADSTAPNYVYVLSGIALLVLLLACFNFTNLSIGLASGRLREIGVRKVLGAGRRQLIRQFWVEAVMQSLLAFVLGLTSAELLLPVFNDLAGTALAFDYRHEGAFLLALVALAGLVGVLAGSYPALVLSQVQPVNVFQGKYRVGGRNALTRFLVVVQFGLSIALIACTFAMRQQQAFMMDRTLNFDAAQVVVIPTQVTPTTEADGDRILDAYKAALARRPEVLRVSGSSSTFGRSSSITVVATEGGERHFVNLNRVDPDYLETLGFELTAGRDFSPDFGDAAAVIVNEAFVAAFAEEFGLDDPVGHTLPRAFAGIENPEIVGVVRDYHYTHVRRPIGPMVWHTNPAAGIRYVLVKIAPDDLSATLAVLRQTWSEARPDEPFDFFFMDEDIERQYQTEARWGQAIGYATAFAVLIACLGLFGLVTLATHRRTKEVGIRKVMGASPRGIVSLLSKEFAVLVLAANVIAVPLAFFALSRWLDHFAYRIDLGAGPFVLAGVLALAVALLTVGVQALRAAFADPVAALRYE